MQWLKRFTSTSFGSAIAGGLVVLAFGVVLIQTGVVDTGDDNGSAPVIGPAPLARPASDTSQGLTVHDIYQRDADGVAFIRSTIVQKTPSVFGLPQQQSSQATGSGFLIDNDGHILTNAHVVEGAKSVTVQLGHGDEQSAQVVGSDPSSDIALLKVDNTEGANPLSLGDSSKVEVGDPVVAIGNPFALDRTVTSGIVSALQRQIQAPNGFSISDVIQTDAAINPGNSGGPLIDAAGRVIGINSQIESQSGGNVGIGFAVPINTARDVVQQLLATGKVQHAFLGITGADVTSQLADVLNLPVKDGALVQSVVKGSPADDAGIQGGSATVSFGGQQIRAGGDIITAIDGNAVHNMDDVVNAVAAKKPGDKVEMTLAHGQDTR